MNFRYFSTIIIWIFMLPVTAVGQYATDLLQPPYGTTNTQIRVTPVIHSSSGDNLDTDDLTCINQNIQGALFNHYNWSVDGKPFAVLNLPFDDSKLYAPTAIAGKASAVMPPGTDFLLSTIQVNQYILASTVTDPAILVRFNDLNDLSNTSTLTFPSTANAMYKNGMAFTYSAVTDKLYLIFSGQKTGNDRTLIVEIDYAATPMTYREIVNDVNNRAGLNSSVVALGDYLYVTTHTNPSTLLKYPINTFSTTPLLKAEFSSEYYATGNVITDGALLYATGSNNNNTNGSWIAKINPANLLWEAQMLPDQYTFLTDDVGLTPTHIWLGDQGSTGHLLKINKFDFSDITEVPIAPNFGTYVVHYDGENIWTAPKDGDAGLLYKVDPLTHEVSYIPFEAAEYSLNEIITVRDGSEDQIFCTFWQSPARIARIPLNSATTKNNPFLKNHGDSNLLVRPYAPWQATGGHDGRGAYQIVNGQNIQVADHAALNFTTGDSLSVALWVKQMSRKTDSYETLIGKRNDNFQNYRLALDFGSGDTRKICFWFSTSGGTAFVLWSSTASYNFLNSYKHIAMKYTFGHAASMKVYLDGVEVAGTWTGDGSATPDQSSGALEIGSVKGGFNLENAFIDDLTMYRRYLSDGQIQNLYLKKPHVIHADETTIGESWHCVVTPNDGSHYGVEKQSNIILIGSTPPPQPDLNAADTGIGGVNPMLQFTTANQAMPLSSDVVPPTDPSITTIKIVMDGLQDNEQEKIMLTTNVAQSLNADFNLTNQSVGSLTDIRYDYDVLQNTLLMTLANDRAWTGNEIKTVIEALQYSNSQTSAAFDGKRTFTFTYLNSNLQESDEKPANGIVDAAVSTIYVDRKAPVISISAPTKTDKSDITNTTIRVVDFGTGQSGITPEDVIIDAASTVGTSGFQCTQTEVGQVDCVVTITSGGHLVIKAQDQVGNTATATESDYMLDTFAPLIQIDAPTRAHDSQISNTTIRVTDNRSGDEGITASNVVIDASSTVYTENFDCKQTNPKQVDCTVTILSSGLLTIVATDDFNNESKMTSNSYTIHKKIQAIIFEPLRTVTFRKKEIALSVSSTSNLPVTLYSTNTDVAIVSDKTLTLTGIGRTTIVASQAGNEYFSPAITVFNTLTVEKGPQTIAFGAIEDKTMGDAPFALNLQGGDSGEPVQVAAFTDRVSILNNTIVHLLKPGKVQIQATQAGNDNYLEAPKVEQFFCVNPPKPVISESKNKTTLQSSSVEGNQWFYNGEPILNEIGPTIQADQSGVYAVQVSIGGCTSALSESVGFVVTGLETTKTNDVKLYPNPTSQTLYIDFSNFPTPEGYVKILDYSGKVMMNEFVRGESLMHIPVQKWPSGMYLVQITNSNVVHTGSFVKQ